MWAGNISIDRFLSVKRYSIPAESGVTTHMGSLPVKPYPRRLQETEQNYSQTDPIANGRCLVCLRSSLLCLYWG